MAATPKPKKNSDSPWMAKQATAAHTYSPMFNATQTSTSAMLSHDSFAFI